MTREPSDDRSPRPGQALRLHHGRRRPVFLHPARHGHRLPRAEQRREDHHHADDPGPRRADAGLGNRRAAAATATCRHPCTRWPPSSTPRRCTVAAGLDGVHVLPEGQREPADAAPVEQDRAVGSARPPRMRDRRTGQPTAASKAPTQWMGWVLLINCDAALGQRFFDVPVEQPVPQVPADRDGDHLRREPEASEHRR
jgi:hypothetical protein